MAALAVERAAHWPTGGPADRGSARADLQTACCSVPLLTVGTVAGAQAAGISFHNVVRVATCALLLSVVWCRTDGVACFGGSLRARLPLHSPSKPHLPQGPLGMRAIVGLGRRWLV